MQTFSLPWIPDHIDRNTDFQILDKNSSDVGWFGSFNNELIEKVACAFY